MRKIVHICVAFSKKLNFKSALNVLWTLKFMFSKKATKIDEIFTVDLTLCSKRQIDGEDFVNFRGLLRKYELYNKYVHKVRVF